MVDQEKPDVIDISGVTYIRADRIPEGIREEPIERHYTVAELSDMSGFSKSEINAAIRRGEMEAVYPNGGTRYRRIAHSEFIRWKRAKTSRASSSARS